MNMAIIKEHDFVEIEYTARIKEDGTIFDTTEEKVAKENNLYDKHSDYSPAVICVGENNILKGLEEQMIGRETGKEYTIEIGSENAFGKKNAKLIQLIPTSKFRQQNINPVPGLQLNIDGVFGVVKTVSGGRCLVDFNHPLAGKDLVYNVKINNIVDNDNEKLKSLLKMYLHIKDADTEINDKSNASELASTSETRSQLTANIISKQDIPKHAQEEFKKIAQRTIPSIKNINFTIVKERK